MMPTSPPPAVDETAAVDEPLVPAEATEAPASPVETPAPRRGHAIATLAAICIAAFALCLTAYLAVAVPGKWFSAAPSLAWGPKDLLIAKGSGRLVGDELHIAPADASGLAVVSLKTSLKSADYAAIEWIAIDIPDHLDVSLIWRSNVKPDQINTLPLTAVSGRLLRGVTRDHAAWIGSIEGLALAMRGPMAEPVRIRGVLAKTLAAPETIVDRWREWFAFEGWSGSSINTVTGGADLQDMPLPVLLGGAVALAALLALALRRWRPSALPFGLFASVVAIALAAWIVLDVRWMWNLARQVDFTAERFGGKSWLDKRLNVEDAPLFAFIQKAKETMPPTPARVFVAADSPYFRGRAAYHLYPHNAFAPRANVLPEPSQVRSGDWIAVYMRKGIQFDAAQGKLRWDNREPVSAELKASARGAALFLVR